MVRTDAENTTPPYELSAALRRRCGGIGHAGRRSAGPDGQNGGRPDGQNGGLRRPDGGQGERPDGGPRPHHHRIHHAPGLSRASRAPAIGAILRP